MRLRSGLLYLRTRYYDADTQQFLTVDPIVAQTGQPYVYTGTNPVSDTDPMGLSPKGGSGGCQCRQSGRGFQQWLSKNWVYVTLLTGIFAAIGIAAGGTAALVLGSAAVAAGAVQLFLDLQKRDQMAAAGDIVGIVLGALGIELSWRTAKLIWDLRGLVGPMTEAIASGNMIAVITLLSRGLGLKAIKGAMDSKSIKYAVYGVAFGVWASVGTGEAACG